MKLLDYFFYLLKHVGKSLFLFFLDGFDFVHADGNLVFRSFIFGI